MLASQPAFTCSKLTIETLEQSVKYGQYGVVLVSLLTLNIFCTLCVSIVNFEHVIAGWGWSYIWHLDSKVDCQNILPKASFNEKTTAIVQKLLWRTYISKIKKKQAAKATTKNIWKIDTTDIRLKY